MDLPSRDQAAFLSSPLQARAFHFFKKFALRTRGSGRRPKDAVSPVAIPSHDFQRAHSSVDLLRKPDISPLIGLRAEDGPNPMDTDDSSQDAFVSGNSPRIRSRCHSTQDSFQAASFHPTFAGRGAAPLFFRDLAGPANELDSGNVLAPAPLFLRSTHTLDAVVQPSPRSPVLHFNITPQIDTTADPIPHHEAVQNTLDDDTPRLSRGVLSLNAPLKTQLDDLVPPSSRLVDPSRSQSTPAPTPELILKRPLLMTRHSASLPPPFCLATERGLRLSPSIIARQPMPLLNLPTLPPAPSQPLVEDSQPRRNAPLQSMPSLSRHGRSSGDCQADHENATLVDSDEGEGEEGDEEEELTDALSAHQRDEEDEAQSANLSCPHGLKSLQNPPTREECPVGGSASTASPHSESVSSNLADHSCSKTYVNPIQIAASPTSVTIHPFPPHRSAHGDVNQCHTMNLNSPKSGARKPSLYRIASRSMIDLGTTHRTEQRLSYIRPGETAGSDLAFISGDTAETRAGSEESDTEVVIGRLLRRTSMPSFHPTSDPPPYPTFNPRPRSSYNSPTENEERLPPYSNSLYLMAIMPRKVEFTSPGVQARDRKWRRVVCELEGTTFRVYKCPPGASGAGVLGDWWEKRVGVGDVASPNPPRTRKKEEQFERPAKLGIDDVPVQAVDIISRGEARPRTESQSSIGTRSTTITPRAAKRISGASFLSPFRSSSSTRPEMSAETSRRPEREHEASVEAPESHSSSLHESTGQATPLTRRLSQSPRSGARLTFLPVGRAQSRNGEIVKPPQSDLIRAYTLQHAESGLGNDYLKRKNVIRVRLEGEQFLLQAPDIPGMVEWIEGLHAGTNIALDIDQRPMPRGPLFPRRRRRRGRRGQGEEPRTV